MNSYIREVQFSLLFKFKINPFLCNFFLFKRSLDNSCLSNEILWLLRPGWYMCTVQNILHTNILV